MTNLPGIGSLFESVNSTPSERSDEDNKKTFMFFSSSIFPKNSLDSFINEEANNYGIEEDDYELMYHEENGQKELLYEKDQSTFDKLVAGFTKFEILQTIKNNLEGDSNAEDDSLAKLTSGKTATQLVSLLYEPLEGVQLEDELLGGQDQNNVDDIIGKLVAGEVG